MTQYLTDVEISKLGIDAEDFLLHQRKMMPLLLSNKRYEYMIIGEEPENIAKHLLKEKFKSYGDGDVKRLTKQISNNFNTMTWYNNLN